MNGNKKGLILRKIIHVGFSFLLLVATYKLEKKHFLALVFSFLVIESLWEVLRIRGGTLLPEVLRLSVLIKEREKKNLSDAWFYVVGVFLASLALWDEPLRALLLILGLSDTLAYVVGKSFDGRALFRGKTVYGSLSFFLSALLILYTFEMVTSLGVSKVLALSLFITICEAISERDNFLIPVGFTVAYLLLTTVEIPKGI